MDALIIIIGVMLLTLLAGRYGVDSRFDDTARWWHNYRDSAAAGPVGGEHR